MPLRTTIHQSNYISSPRYIWRPTAISSFESLWSILNKFVYLNEATTFEIKKVFADDEWQTTRRNWNYWLSRYDAFNRLDENRIRENLRLTQKQTDLSVMEIYKLSPKWFTTERVLRYCPVCIKKGFHSALFQQRWLAKCPLHNRLLVNRCPLCGDGISYSYANGELDHPYACRCGYNLWPGIEKDKWGRGITHKQKKLLDNYLLWRKEIRKNRDFDYIELADIAYVNRQSEYVNQDQIMHCITSIKPIVGWPQHLFRQPDKDTHSVVDCGISMLHKVDRPNDLSEVKDVETLSQAKRRAEEVTRYTTIANSYRRYLKKRVFRKHKRCLEEYRGALVFNDISRIPVLCRCAHAYYLWEEYWDKYCLYKYRHEQVVDQENSNETVNTDIYSSNLHFYDTVNTIIDSNVRFSECTSTRKTRLAQWIIQHIFNLCLTSTFNEAWKLSACLEKTCPEQLEHRTIQEMDKFLFLYMRKDSTHPDRFHIWRNITIDAELKKLNKIEPGHFGRLKEIGGTLRAASGRKSRRFAYSGLVYRGNMFIRKHSKGEFSEKEICERMNYVPSGKRVFLDPRTPIRPRKPMVIL